MNYNNINKKRISIVLILSLLLIIGVSITFALFVFRSNNNTDVNVISRGLDYYINYTEGTSIISSQNETLTPSWDYTGGISTTIEFWKSSTSPYDIYGYLYMDIKSIGDNLKAGSALKWVLIKNSEIISQGTFLNKSTGDTITLFSNTSLQTTEQEYIIYIWLNEEEVTSTNIAQEPISVEIRAEATM